MSFAQFTGRKSLEAIAANVEGHGNGLTKTLDRFCVIGLVIYFGYGHRHSVVTQAPDA